MNLINIFSIPVFTGEIDAQRIIFKKTVSFLHPFSGTETLRGKVTDESVSYLCETLTQILEPHMPPFKMKLHDVWENVYKKGDVGHAHIHHGGKLSFIIYKSGKANTVLLGPYHYLGGCMDMEPPLSDLYPWYVIPPMKVNQVLIFPSFLEHMVKKVTEDGITISGDIVIKSDLPTDDLITKDNPHHGKK